MTTPRGCLQVLTRALMRLARRGDVAGFRAYVGSDAFLAAFDGLDPGRRQSAMRTYAKAEALCEAKARPPLIQPRPIHSKGGCRTNWSNPEMRPKLAVAFSQGAGDAEAAARIRGVSPGSARLAKKRHLDVPPAGHRQKIS